MSEFMSIQMDPSVGNRGVPEIMGRRLVKPIFKRKPKFKTTTLSEMFDDDYLSLLAVRMYPKFPIDQRVQVDRWMQDGERVCVARVPGYEFVSHGEKIFITKRYIS